MILGHIHGFGQFDAAWKRIAIGFCCVIAAYLFFSIFLRNSTSPLRHLFGYAGYSPMLICAALYWAWWIFTQRRIISHAKQHQGNVCYHCGYPINNIQVGTTCHECNHTQTKEDREHLQFIAKTQSKGQH